MLGVANNTFILGVIMLNVSMLRAVMLSVVAHSKVNQSAKL
jgi:hypothetical protein